jgi:hypothetical protein
MVLINHENLPRKGAKAQRNFKILLCAFAPLRLCEEKLYRNVNN